MKLSTSTANYFLNKKQNLLWVMEDGKKWDQVRLSRVYGKSIKEQLADYLSDKGAEASSFKGSPLTDLRRENNNLQAA